MGFVKTFNVDVSFQYLCYGETYNIDFKNYSQTKQWSYEKMVLKFSSKLH